MILYINSCTRTGSRTNDLSLFLLDRLGTSFTEINLYQKNLRPIDENFINLRSELASRKDFSDPIFECANLFAEADTIVISAPFWDSSFPSALKVFVEHIYAIGLTTDYGSSGEPVGMCRAKKLYYVSTAGGKFVPDFGFNYIKHLCQEYFGIPQVELIMAENLDLPGYDAEEILAKTKQKIMQMEL